MSCVSYNTALTYACCDTCFQSLYLFLFVEVKALFHVVQNSTQNEFSMSMSCEHGTDVSKVHSNEAILYFYKYVFTTTAYSIIGLFTPFL